MPHRLMVAPETAHCVGVGPMRCLQIKRPGELDWRLHYGRIEGYDHVEGTAWLLLVEERRVPDPPADAADRILVLREPIARDVIPPTLAGRLVGLAGTGWRLQRVEPAGGIGEAWRAHGLSLVLEGGSGRVGGRSACNRWFASWTVGGETVRSGPIGATRMACRSGEAAAVESAWLGHLENVRELRWWGTEVELVTAAGTRLLLERLLE